MRFGAFEANLCTGETRKHGIRIKLRGHPQAILAMLLDSPGEIVTRERIREKLWPADTFVDFEHSVNTAIKTLRQALGDSAETPEFIETIPRVGYRFIAEVRRNGVDVESRDESPAAVAEQPTPAGSGSAGLPARDLRSLNWLASVAMLLMVMGVAAAAIFWLRAPKAGPNPGARVMIAVMPFENMTGDASQEYFSDGLTEEMISQLGRSDPQRIGVIARTSVMQYKLSQASLTEIGRALGVRYLLEGSVRRDAGRVRITAKMIQAQDQTQLWSREYDRDVSSLLALQSEIAQEIADEIQTTLGYKSTLAAAPGNIAGLSPQASEAHDLYLRGLYAWNKRTFEGFQQAANYFQQATAKDPSNARAFAGLANAYALEGSYNLELPKAQFEKAKAAALQALALDEKLPEAHTALAFAVETLDWDWQAAEKEYARAIQLDPSYATAHQWYAECLTFEGRFDVAFAESERARQLDPLSLIIAADHAAILYFSRQYDRSIDELKSILQAEPNFPRANLIVFAYSATGQYSEALAHVQRQGNRFGEPWSLSIQAFIYGREGQKSQARGTLRRLEALAKTDHTYPKFAPTIPFAYMEAGESDAAIRWLQQLADQRATVLLTIKVDSAFDSMRGDPRFQEILRRVRLAD